MNLIIVQLSDLHIGTPTDAILMRAGAIAAAVRPNLAGECALLLACTGDIANTGVGSQYKAASDFLRELSASLTELPQVHFLGAVCVPGNHDCDFSEEGDVRPVLLASIASALDTVDLQGESVQQLLKVQKNFFDFENGLCNYSTPLNRLTWQVTFTYAGNTVLVRCLNTALFSRLREAPGQLLVPLKSLTTPESDNDFVVTMFHHPYAWLAPDNSRELRRFVELNSDLVLTGHEHEVDYNVRITRTGDETGYVEGAALQGSSETGFNIIVVNPGVGTNQIVPYRWSNGIYEPGPAEARVFTRKQSLMQFRFRNTADFAKELNDIGTGFSHPHKELTLRDLFVYPDLKLANFSVKNQTSIQSGKLLQFVLDKQYLYIAGAPLSGKSTLARALYLDLQQKKDLVPLLIDGGTVKSVSGDGFNKAIERAFKSQYHATMYERFRQLESDKKVLLIDDWHRTHLNTKAKGKVLESARAMFGKVIIFSDDASVFQLLADTAEGGDASEAQYCEIKQFGYRLRSELIRKWHGVGSDFEIDDLESTHTISTSEHVLDTLVGKGVVPSWPIYILFLLQASSAVAPETASYGSYGHLYEALLTKRMADFSKRPQSLGLKYTYLSIFAYQLFKSGTTTLTGLELRELTRRYEADYHVTLDENDLWLELEAAQVLSRSRDEFRFTYKYAYYFFVAKYFQQGIGNIQEATTLRTQLQQMVHCIHDEDYANILIFYIYLTKDRKVIEQMLGVASRIFSDKEPANLGSDIEFINKLRDRPPDILLAKRDIDTNRDEYRSRLDASDEKEESATSEGLVRTEYRDDISDSLKIDFALRSIQVMGQVVKNFPLDLKGDLKLALTRESYELTLRTLRTFLGFIETNMADVLALLEKALRNMEPFSKRKDEEFRDASVATVVRLTEFAIFGMIKRVSNAVGVVELTETYSQVRRAVGEDRIPTRLIDLAIKLDHFGHIPESEVREMEHLLRRNVTAYTILKVLVAEFLHLFPCDYKTEQRMVELFKFKPHIPKLAQKRVKNLSD